MYVRSELLDQVEQQVRAKFGDEITSFEWFYEEGFTGIYIEIRSQVMQIPVIRGTRQIINECIGEPGGPYIVSLSVSPIESVGCTDGQFNLTYEGGGEYFWVDYYAPERPRSHPFVASISYYTMKDAVRTIHLDSPTQFWERLFHPLKETFAKQEGVPSFSKHLLAEDLRDFLLEHLDFIKHIAAAKGRSLEILEPAPRLASQSKEPNGNRQQTSLGRRKELALAGAGQMANACASFRAVIDRSEQ